MTPAERLTIVKALLDIARPEILRHYRPDSCIGSTRIGIDVLAYFGVGSRPLPVEATLFNRGGMKAAMEGRMCEGDEWGVGLGVDDDSCQVGHLVILLDEPVRDEPDQVTFVDLSLDQADRPQKGIYAAPAVFTGSAKFLVGDIWLEFPQSWGLIGYRRSANETYKTSPNWRRGATEKKVTGLVIRAMRTELAARGIAGS